MPGPAKGSRAAHERALKAAETRRRNRQNAYNERLQREMPGLTVTRNAPITRKLRNPLATPRKAREKKPPPFPTSYHATPTRHVTRDLKMKELKPKSKRHSMIAPKSVKQIRAMDNAELERQYRYWWQGIGRDKSIPVPKRMGGELPYKLREEHDRRYTAGHGNLPRIQAHQARRGVKKQRGAK